MSASKLDLEKYMMNGGSKDVILDRIELIKHLFPEVLTGEKIDIDRLSVLLGNDVENSKERYDFTWKGKLESLRLSGQSIYSTLKPCKEGSKNWDSTENLYIEGDNLDVLKLLQKSYFGKVKMIYIDPPYNTGHDFVYKDTFSDTIANYKELTNQTQTSNPETSGKYHTNWLNMMYPRLLVAKTLLRDDGVIFISIDDNEQDNLKKLCNEVFGEDNFIGCAGRITKKSNNKGDFWAPNFDYILTYSKNKDFLTPFLGHINEADYNLYDNDGPRKNEKYQLVRLYMSTIENQNLEQRYWIDCPDGSKVIPPGRTFPPERPLLGDGIWRWTYKKFIEERDRIVIKSVKSSNLIADNNEPAKWNVFVKTYLNDVIANARVKPNCFIEPYINQLGSTILNELDIPFSYSKPYELIKYLIDISRVTSNDLVLDFFSGSGTTAHAVMQLNAEDGGNRKFIMVQLPEKTKEGSEAFKAGYKNICEIGKERIRRAGDKILEDLKKTTPEWMKELGEDNQPCNLDIGFKVFKLDYSNIKKWDTTYNKDESVDDLLNRMNDMVDIVKSNSSDFDVVYELMLKNGLNIHAPITAHDFLGVQGYVIGKGCEMIICLSKGVTVSVVDAMKQLTPGTIIFGRNSFNSLSDITNVLEEVKDNDDPNCNSVEIRFI